MENASKALTMAGGVLLSLIVIGALMLMYRSLTNAQNMSSDTDIVKQAAEFNRPYEVYNAETITGNDIFSLANMIENYNVKESENKGYTKITMTVQIKTVQGFYKYIEKKTYQTPEEITTLRTEIENRINEILSNTYGSSKKKIDYLAGLYTNQLESLVSGSELSTVNKLITEYTNLNTELTEFKAKTFTTTFKYDEKTTGRINEIIVKEK